ncbi:hypothetical protein [Hyphomicrobium sp. NDB2Meth4]|uniref:hypothetical protein n=1 Tax=Hyphomicrobium sp. NDB2Meth4 TaxID=1892846 RepID=UPI00093104CC|nr:hypothetical protein [Hyphomicrobium sp. NDB2Meth4]
MSDESNSVDRFMEMFATLPAERSALRKQRAKAERRSQLTAAQRQRQQAKRTSQINFRCSPEFFADAHHIKGYLAEQRGHPVSVADVLEEALVLLKRRHDYKGTRTA